MMNTPPNEGPNPFAGWGPSIRALCLTNSYEEYLELMAQYQRELALEHDPDYEV